LVTRSAIVRLSLRLGIILLELDSACLGLEQLSGRHVAVTVELESAVTLQVSVAQRVAGLPEWAQGAVFSPKKALNPAIGVDWPGAGPVTGLITEAALQRPVELRVREIATGSSEHTFKVIWLVSWVLGFHGKQAGGKNLPVVRVKPSERTLARCRGLPVVRKRR
jgi:hypothetical protein